MLKRTGRKAEKIDGRARRYQFHPEKRMWYDAGRDEYITCKEMNHRIFDELIRGRVKN